MKRLLVLGLPLLVACASAPRPSILSEADGVSRTPAAVQAKSLAPQQHARAEKLRSDAEQAFEGGDRSGAQLLAEHAVAAYSHAFVLSRLANAERRLSEAKARLAAGEKALGGVDEQQARTATEADALEGRVKVARDALPIVPNGPAGPEREKARLAAARGLAVQARLLCVATQMLSPSAAGLSEQLAALDKLDTTLAGDPETTPIDDALKLRSGCLRTLTGARRSATAAAPAAGAADALLAELSRAGDLSPSRDDRGVVVTLRSVIGRAGTLSAAGKQKLEQLGRIAQAQGVAVLVVVHGTGKPGSAGKPGEALAAALTGAGAARVEVRSAGSSLPVADPASRDAARRNERIEVVFVVPAA